MAPYYDWVNKAERYGLSALLPNERRKPHQPNTMSGEEVAVIGTVLPEFYRPRFHRCHRRHHRVDDIELLDRTLK